MRLMVFLTSLLIILSTSFCTPAQVLNIQDGIKLFDQKQYEKAQVHFQSLFEKHPDNADVACYLGKSALASGDYGKAVEVLEKAVKIDSTRGDCYYVLGLAYARTIPEVGVLKKVGVAKKMQGAMLSAVRLDAKNSDARISLISFYLSAPGFAGGSLDEAKKHLAMLKEQSPDRAFIIEGSVLEKEENRLYRKRKAQFIR